MACSGVYTVTRRLGALQDTCANFEKEGMATILDVDCETETEYQIWTDAAADALRNKKWEKVSVDPEQFSWKGVAQEWLDTFLDQGEGTTQQAVGS